MNKRVWLVGIFLLGYLFVYTQFHIGFPCVFYEVTNLYCPGCGITRMALYLLHLDFIRAFRANSLVLVLLILYLLCRVFKIKLPRYTVNVVLVMTILFGVLRNIPYFYFLRPL